MIICHIAVKQRHLTIFDKPEPVRNQLNQMRIMADKNDTAIIRIQGMNQGFAAFDIKMVCWLIQNQNMRRINRRNGHQQPRLLPA